MVREFVSPGDLENIAQKFLQEFHPSEEVPVPIEEIVEFGLELNIVPIPGLYRDFGTESWLSYDQKSIYIDLKQCEEMETRYRFSLAHEVGHLLLHKDLYAGTALDSLEDWLLFQERCDPQLRDNLEWQARSLAGRILVPADPLRAHAQDLLRKMKSRLRRTLILKPFSVPCPSLWPISSMSMKKS